MSRPKGPHVPTTTVAGHFLSMQPSTDPKDGPDKVWYGGEFVVELNDEKFKYRRALEAILAIFNDPNETGDAESLVKILDIVEAALK